MKFLAAVSVLAVCTNAAENGLGRLPPQAWRSWNAFHENFNQSKTTPTFYIDLLIYLFKKYRDKPHSFYFTPSQLNHALYIGAHAHAALCWSINLPFSLCCFAQVPSCLWLMKL